MSEGFSFVHFTFAHRFSLTVFHSLVFIPPKCFQFFLILKATFGISRHLPLPAHHQEHITLHHPFAQRAHSHFIDVTEQPCFVFYF
jgi:hypothetical protein